MAATNRNAVETLINRRPGSLSSLLLAAGVLLLVAGGLCLAVNQAAWVVMGLGLLALSGGLVFWNRFPRDPLFGAIEFWLRDVFGDQRRAFNLLPVGVFIANPQGRAFRANLEAMRLMDMDQATFLGVDWLNPAFSILAMDGHPMPLDQTPFHQAIASRERTSATLAFEQASNGDWIWIQMTVQPRFDPRGRIRTLFCTLEDITQRRTAETELIIQSFRDRLTSLPNRALFMERLGQALLRGERRTRSSALLFLDLDRFKVVNDSLGHEAGDQLLIQVSRRIRKAIRPEDTVARLSGDEFVVLFEDIQSINDGLRVAERIKASFSDPFELLGRDLYVTCSMGLAVGSASMTPSELLRDAEVAMFRAKAKDAGTIEIFDPSINAQAIARFHMEADMRRALDRQEFILYYQPLVCLRTGMVEGWEALVRWKHPEKGLIPPLHFIPLAEETGLIVPLGRWVLEEAVRQASIWRVQFASDPPRLISVNLSARQFQQQDLIQTVTDALDSSNFDPRCLKLEITESVMMRDPKATLEALNTLRGLDIHLVVDDFGTGYSSLSYLKRFPVDTLKVDKSFVDGLGKDSESTAIVKAVISLAKSLGMRVTAEGIETEDQLERLRALDCDLGQGYLFSRPVPAAEAEAFLKNRLATIQ